MEREDAYFVTFADSKYSESLKRISKEAKALRYFNKIFSFDEKDIEEEYWDEHKDFILNNKRGYGYWIWKPHIILKALEKIEEGSMLVYSDAGFIINQQGRERLDDYVDLAKSSESGILSFHLKGNHRMVNWTKMSVLIDMNFTSEEEIETPQIISGLLIMRNDNFVRGIIREWLAKCQDYWRIDDSESITPNSAAFMEHRHDQSVLSIILRKNHVEPMPDETYFSPRWGENVKYPFHARRDLKKK